MCGNNNVVETWCSCCSCVLIILESRSDVYVILRYIYNVKCLLSGKYTEKIVKDKGYFVCCFFLSDKVTEKCVISFSLRDDAMNVVCC